MLELFISNRLETLNAMLNSVLADITSSTLQRQNIMVQNNGMGHWLMLQMANDQGIAMNLQMEQPMQGIWHILREIDPSLSQNNHYTADVLVWRIYTLLSDAGLMAEAKMQFARDYCQSTQRQFQLASELANVFEQYQIYRPDWIIEWSAGRTVHTAQSAKTAEWQALIWQRLIAQPEAGDHPVLLMERAKKVLQSQPDFTTQHRILFAFNSLPPIWLDFFRTVAEKQAVYLFLLNPCNEYWQGVQSGKKISRQRLANLALPASLDDLWFDVGNPLLANLGQQGQAFIKELYDGPMDELSLFNDQFAESLLGKVQHDIFTMQTNQDAQLVDESIVISQAHSPMREVQVLHDWLLAQFAKDATLQPQDVLVMCPAIEDYAGFIDAVFKESQYAHQPNRADSLSPQLPCSIADRKFNADCPLVVLFLTLLRLPSARFEVNEIVDLMHSPFVQHKFGWSDADIETMRHWLAHAHVHWGKNSQHRETLGLPKVEHFHWQQGLERLLLGFAYQDANQIWQEQLLLDDVEGSDSILLGQLIHFIETLKHWAAQLHQGKTVSSWHEQLMNLYEALFVWQADYDEYEFRLIEQAIAAFGANTSAAAMNEQISLLVVRDFFISQFSRSLPGKNFLTGQITFCSMIPMRSIPFKIIAVLGLNDGEFPRAHVPLSLDLMAQEPPRFGDRSRRNDDRYLFLETLMAAQHTLYLSYQGHNIQNNNERQPSVVLTELMHYLTQYYGWHAGLIRKAPLQVFDARHFSDDDSAQPWATMGKSFDQGWLRLAKQLQQQPIEQSSEAVLSQLGQFLIADERNEISLKELVDYFANPPRYFAQKRLGLYLANDGLELNDSEPFAVNHLHRYQFQTEVIQCALQQQPAEVLLAQWQLSGKLPANEKTNQQLSQWHDSAVIFADLVSEQSLTDKQRFSVQGAHYEFVAELALTQNSQLFIWRYAVAKGKDKLHLWLAHLLVNRQQSCPSFGLFRGPNEQILQLTFAPLSPELAQAYLQPWLECWQQGQQQLSWLSMDIMLGLVKWDKKSQSIKSFNELASQWYGDLYNQRADSDEYYQYFWPNMPHCEAIHQQIIARLITPMLTHMQEQMV